MQKYKIRFNKSRGDPGRGTKDHVWRVFEGKQEYIVKHFQINVPTFSEADESGADWNVCCFATMTLNKETSTAIFN
jgi:hypothetical protein